MFIFIYMKKKKTQPNMQKRGVCLVNRVVVHNMQGLVCNNYGFSFFPQEREEKFRKTSEQTNSNILWWAVVQTLILVSIGIWQIKSLRDFFIAKKLV